MIGENDIKDGVFEILSDTMEWAFDKDTNPSEALNYIFGTYDLARNLLRKVKAGNK